MKQRLLALILCMGIVCTTLAQQVSFTDAQKAAANFLNCQQKAMPVCAYMEQDQGETLYYVFNADNRFVVIAGDERCVPVLAYSDQTSFDSDDIIPPLQMWLDNYRQQLQRMRNEQEVTIAPKTEQWQRLTSGAVTKGDKTQEVAPLLHSKWNQSENYNLFCPKDPKGSYNGRAVTGCVATAMAQVMYYFRFPETGEGSYSYEHEKYGTISADFSKATYDFNAMCDEPTRINPAISLMIHHCGVAVDMVYGPGASGMYNHKAAYALRTYFKYSPETEYLYRDSTDINWDSVLVSHLERRIPMYYAGWSVPNINGHGFVCDGYKLDADSNLYFHFNFGWGGIADGYFYTNSLYVSGSNFNLAQEVIINGYPDTTRFTYPVPPVTETETLTTPAGSLVVGSGLMSECPAKYDHSWVITPDTTNLQSISLTLRNQLPQGDTIFVNGQPIEGNKYQKTFTQWPVTVRLLTADSDSLRQFDGDYTTTYMPFCATPVIKTSTSGVISDGSGDRPYNHCSRCQARIIAPKCDYIEIHFNYFRTEKDKDILYVFDVEKDSLMAQFSGNMDGRNYSFGAKRLLFIFDTDDQNADEGWELTYSARTGIPEYKNQEIAIYPNPADNHITLKTTGNAISAGQPIYLFDMQGRLLRTWTRNGEETQTLSLSDISNGIYVLKVGDVTRKIVKR